jgi:hypothetical protein
MRTPVFVLIFALVFAVGFASAQITLKNSATGGPPTATTVGTAHSLDTTNVKVGAGSVLRTPASGTSHLPTKAALDPNSTGNGGTGAAPGFTIQWWYKPAGPTAFGYLWSDRGWSSFRCFQNGAAGTGNVIVRGSVNDCATSGAPLQNATDPNGWLHLAVVVDTKAKTTTWYVNGKKNNSVALTVSGKGTNLQCFGDSGSSSGYQGNCDDFRIYDWARTAADIAADYNTNAKGIGPSGSPNVPDLGYYECEPPTSLVATGTPKPGGTIDLALSASSSANLAYQIGSSLGTGPIPIGTRNLGLSLDGLLVVTVSGALPSVFSGYVGSLDAQGAGKAKINIPAVGALVGIRLHSAFLTLSGSAPNGVQEISNTASFSITN